jgi:hypothetical protein
MTILIFTLLLLAGAYLAGLVGSLTGLGRCDYHSIAITWRGIFYHDRGRYFLGTVRHWGGRAQNAGNGFNHAYFF